MSQERQAMLLLLPPQLKNALRVVAREHKRSMTREIELAIEKHIAAPAQVSVQAGDRNG